MSSLERWFRFSVVIACAIAGLGCATKVPLYPSDEARTRLGRVAVVTAGEDAEADISYPVSGPITAATAGAGAGLVRGVLAGAICFLCVLGGGGCGITGIVACPIALWTPVMVVNGAVEGAVKAVPSREVESGARALQAALRDIDFQKALRDGVVEITREDYPTLPMAAHPAAPPAGDGGTPAYRSLAGEGIDTVLELTVAKIGLERASGDDWDQGWWAIPSTKYWGASFSIEGVIDPPMAFVLEVRARLIRAADDEERFSQVFTRRGPGHAHFAFWTREDSRAFRDWRDHAVRALGRDIAGAFFGAAVSKSD